MRFGINTFLFTWPFTNQSAQWFPRFSRWGFQSVEIPIDNLNGFDPAFISDRLRANGLVCGTVTPCLGPDKDLRGSRESQRAGVRFMKRAIDRMVELGARSLVGVVYSTVGRAEAVPPAERRRQWKTVAGNLREVCDYAGERGRSVALEAINRFETDFINTCDQGLEMIDTVGSPALKLHLDTFHMNIEEKDPAAAIRKAGKRLGHFHACGSDRGTPGNDDIDWRSIAAALRAVRYDGDVVIESFTSDVKVIARAASIWRRIEPTREEIAWKGIRFLRKALAPT
ncbi:MAG: sugar phosphate isomerase/epimerase [Verrucomicrobia bacterium]|nr:sugar phosphate isomerase/epimerase [Verrucomicrobiota bacterium]MBI3870942.1 sugar phosphate isomerase/epimerase [Verrucomicrobiota bacterium]